MWFVILGVLGVIGVLQWFHVSHDPTQCRDLIQESLLWDTDVSTAIRTKARAVLKQSIVGATWGLMDHPRGGECALDFSDIQAVLSIVFFVWVITKVGLRPKCASSWRSCQRTRLKTVHVAEPTEEETEAPPKQDSHVCYRKLPAKRNIRHRSQTRSPLVPMEITTSLPTARPVHGNIVRTV